ncbi:MULTISPECIES: DUF4278 domain-containing protein [unclassified Leptolyngbya]|uniref:DUF4278 domain-containing protein n=1 Tax=unclassified Leptolyngbya TaxID=2650499 RepID=UPI00168976AA|nr:MULTISPECIES: DUF4278 domain-containing protein [unclassified Leptolyngbya]MBD1913652.1 DUF4278 domain-containing protein [Leptolyngbya sp. FACHB-8]MBD2158250.1 DUF4278 domain-containing protein [Leptolyngbya sp. FACHB-16]
MELFYRGAPHESVNPEVEMIDSGYEGRFLGRAYKIQQGKVTQHYTPVSLKYRGIHYRA